MIRGLVQHEDGVRRPGYTLVELLVVMTIILLIAGILITVIRKILQLIHTLFQSGLIS